MTNKICTGLLALAGAGTFATDQYMNVEYMIGVEGGVTSSVVAVPVAGLACVLAWSYAWNRIFRLDLASGLAALATFGCLCAFSLGASLDRAANSYDDKISRSAAVELEKTIAEAEFRKARADLSAANAAVVAEIDDGGCGKKCRDKKTEVVPIQARYDAAKARYVALGPSRPSDPMAARVAALGVADERQVQTFFPLLLPFGIYFASIAFLGGALTELFRSVTRAPATEDEIASTRLRVIREYERRRAATGRTPTRQEIADALGVHRTTVSRYLRTV